MKIILRKFIIPIASEFWLRGPEVESKNNKLGHFRKRVASLVLAILLGGVTPTLAGDVIFNSDFEAGKIQGWVKHDGKLPGAITVQSNKVRAGRYGVKLHMKRCSWANPLCPPKPVNLGRPRAQLHKGGGLALPMNKSTWLGYSILLPNDFNPTREMVAGVNAHNSPGGPGDCQNTGAAQPFSFRLSRNKYIMRSTTESTPKKWRQFDLATIKKGQWMDVVVNWNWSYANNGFWKIWINGKQVVNFKGSTMCRATRRVNKRGGLPYLNATNYYAAWNTHDSSIKSLTLFVDEIRVGGSSTSYKDVAPHGAAKAGGTTKSTKARGTTKSTTAAKRQPVATKGKRRLYSSCNKLKGKKRDACARQVRAYNRSLGYAG